MGSFKERTDYNNVISVKLVIPSGCNANCSFCYMKDSKLKKQYDKKAFLRNFTISLTDIVREVGGKNPISLDIIGNEPTYDPELLIEVLRLLKELGVKKDLCRVTMTTNGYRLNNIIPYLKGVVDYVNISIHDYRCWVNSEIMGVDLLDLLPSWWHLYLTSRLAEIGIKSSVTAVIDKEIPEFSKWRESFVNWAEDHGFIGIRFRCNVFLKNKEHFEQYMSKTINDKRYTVITHENTPDSHWCRLRRKDGFRVFFLRGVVDASAVTKGIEYVINDDGKLYCDFYKKMTIEDYKKQYEVGKIYDYTED